jgi:hypothetical protein
MTDINLSLEKRLLDLSNAEIDLYEKVNRFKGTFEEREKHITDLGIDVAYKNIFLRYHTLFIQYKDQESLKRSIFIQWYAQAEPMAFTGINALDEQTERDNVLALCHCIENREVDREFAEMVHCYYDVAEWVFDHFVDFTHYISLLKKRKTPLILPSNVNRGRMGIYFSSRNLDFF